MMDTREALEVKNIITSLLISTPLRMTISQLVKDYRDIEGRHLPYRELGFVSIEDYLRSIPETVNIYGSGPFAEIEAVVTSKSEHINTMVLKQKKSKVHSHKNAPMKKFHPVYMKPSRWDCYFPKINSPARYQPKVFNNYNKPEESITSKNESEVANSNMLHITTEIDLQSEEAIENCKLFFELENDCDTQIENSVVNETQKEAILVKPEVSESHSSEMNCYLPVVTNTELAFKDDNESHSPMEATCVALDVQGVENLELSEHVKVYSSDHVERPENISSAEEDCMHRVSVKVQKNLKNLMQHFSNGIECTKLPAEYRKMFKRKLCYEDFGYRSLIAMCSDLPEIFYYVQQTSHDYMLYDKTRPVPVLDQKVSLNKCVQRETIAKTHILEELPKVDKLTCSALIPTDAIKMSDEIGRLFPSDVVVGDLLEINIGEIFDLSKFWIYLTFGKLDELMKELQDFFLANHKRYQIPELLLDEGLYCVALYDGQYHRCVIVDLLHKIPHFVRVFFIDYGTVNNVHTDEIWFLPKQFGELPGQAIRARLSNIYPVYENRPWSADAVARFEQLVSHRVVVAEVTKVDEQDHVLEIYLADITNKENIFFINDIFVEEGYALYTDQERRKTHLIDHDCIPNVRYIHLYPEFYEIEAGLAPTTDEKRYINENKIPLPYFMPQYFDIHYYEDINGIQLQHEKFNQKRIPDITIGPLEPDEFDFDFFPDCLKSEIRELYAQDNADKLKISKSGSRGDTESETNESVKEYFCNKKRISELIHGTSTKIETCESKDYSDNSELSLFKSSKESNSLEHVEDVVPLNNSFQKLSLNSSEFSSRNSSMLRTSTNPFLNDTNVASVSTNPFRPTNPFLNDIEETVNNSDLLNLFAKSSEETLPKKIINNLKDTHGCKCKMNKQIKVENSPLRNNPEASNSASGGSASSISNISCSSPSSSAAADVPRRIRTPPGFSSIPPQSRPPVESTFNSFLNYVPNNFSSNSCYPSQPFTQFNNNNYLAQNQLYLSMNQPFINGYFNSAPQFYPSQYNFNPNWQQLFTPPSSYVFPAPSSYGAPSPSSYGGPPPPSKDKS